ncbi:MAG: outer membrane lipoprotein carrier protein LolA [Spirochaetaceae bacterium]|jgi:hypothetical protein|nr:outer membrane lipoprotein carrier protein LolA [Spirochaetaceae bacterium]
MIENKISVSGKGLYMRPFFVFILFILSTSLFALELFDSPLNMENKKIVEAIFSEISLHNLVTSEFFQEKRINRLNRTINSSGSMIFDSSKGIAWLIQKPFPSTTVLTDDAIIQKSPGGQVRILSAEGNETFQRFSLTIQSVFLGQMALILEEYDIYFLDGEIEPWRIGLIPKDSALKGIIKAIEINGDKFIHVFKISEANGDDLIYQFENINFPDKLSEDELRVFE